MAEESNLPAIERAISNAARARPVLAIREKPESAETRNPFAALDEVHRDLVACHERLSGLAAKLAGDLPAYEAAKDEPGGGLLGLSYMTAVAMRHRIRHIGELTARIEEYLS